MGNGSVYWEMTGKWKTCIVYLFLLYITSSLSKKEEYIINNSNSKRFLRNFSVSQLGNDWETRNPLGE